MSKYPLTWGLVGCNINYSLSPLIHNFFAKSCGFSAKYKIYDMPLEKFIQELFCRNINSIVGFNITTPYKKEILKFFPSDNSSVNTIYRRSTSLVSCSTDISGFTKGLQRTLGYDLLSFKKITILGSGGSCCAFLDYLQQKHYKNPIVILRRSPWQDAKFKGYSLKLSVGDFTAESLKKHANSESSSLVIQATNAPNCGNDLRHLADFMQGFNGVFCDLVYNNPSFLYKRAQELGIPAIEGTSMLIEQARLSQMLWWKEAISYESALQLVEKYKSDVKVQTKKIIRK